jgi:hypothetical protein
VRFRRDDHTTSLAVARSLGVEISQCPEIELLGPLQNRVGTPYVWRNFRGERNSEKASDAAAASFSLGIKERERESRGSLKLTRRR